MNSRDKDSSARREHTEEYGKIPRGPSSSRPWQLSKDPRIVRVSRSFGGKDRHSKVCTVKGLRDRRVRLSVQTAIQLYDLQDRLGLNQPSKVVDWLLEAAQHDIDKLPPLQMPIENLVQFGQPMLVPHEMNPSFGAGHSSSLANITAIQSGNDNGNGEDEMKSTRPAINWNPDARLIGERSKQSVDKENNWLKMIEQESHEGSSHGHGAAAAIMNQSSHTRASQKTLTGFINNVVPYAPHFHWEAPSSSFVSHNRQQTEESSSATNLPSSLSLSSGSQLLFYPSSMVPAMLPSYVSAAATDLDSKHINHVQMQNPSSQNLLQNSIAASVYSINAPSMIPFQVNIASRQEVPENERDRSMSSMALTSGSFRENPKTDAGSNPSSY